MKRAPARDQGELDRHERNAAPWHLAEEGERNAREDVRARGAPMRQNRRACSRHMRFLRVVADELEGVIGLHRAAQVERAARVERPSAADLARAQIAREALLEMGIDFVEVVHHQHVLGGNGAVGFELVAPVPLGLLRGQQCAKRVPCRGIEPAPGALNSADGGRRFRTRSSTSERTESRGVITLPEMRA